MISRFEVSCFLFIKTTPGHSVMHEAVLASSLAAVRAVMTSFVSIETQYPGQETRIKS